MYIISFIFLLRFAFFVVFFFLKEKKIQNTKNKPTAKQQQNLQTLNYFYLVVYAPHGSDHFILVQHSFSCHSA